MYHQHFDPDNPMSFKGYVPWTPNAGWDPAKFVSRKEAREAVEATRAKRASPRRRSRTKLAGEDKPKGVRANPKTKAKAKTATTKAATGAKVSEPGRKSSKKA